MIDEKKIEEAVNELYNSNAIFRRYDQAEIGFKAGINWFLENLWHNASEEPKEGLKLIVEMTNEECHSACYINEWYYISDVNRECEVSVKADSIYRWLYFEDLMKGGK